MDESQKHYMEQKKPERKEYICDFIYKKFHNSPNYSVVVRIQSVVSGVEGGGGWGGEQHRGVCALTEVDITQFIKPQPENVCYLMVCILVTFFPFFFVKRLC